MVTMVLPTPSSKIMPKHDEDMGGTGKKKMADSWGQCASIRHNGQIKHMIIHYKTHLFGSKRARQRPEE
jgi:hypothetical protein